MGSDTMWVPCNEATIPKWVILTLDFGPKKKKKTCFCLYCVGVQKYPSVSGKVNARATYTINWKGTFLILSNGVVLYEVGGQKHSSKP